jgi:hypothetical protein
MMIVLLFQQEGVIMGIQRLTLEHAPHNTIKDLIDQIVLKETRHHNQNIEYELGHVTKEGVGHHRSGQSDAS